jgi:type II secretory pathway pseudopilin PulG
MLAGRSRRRSLLGSSPVGERGATLIEVVVAISLLGLGLVGLAASFPLAYHGVRQGGLQITATALAQEILEDARRTPYDSLPSLAATRAAVSGFAVFDREVVVDDYSPATGCTSSPSPACRQITVRTYVTEQQGEVQTTLTTVIARP